MINPGGVQAGVQQNKGAATRMDNAKAGAKQQTMVGNPAAQQSLKKQTSQVRVSPVGRMQGQPEMPTPKAPVQLPTAGQAMPAEASEGFDPEIFKEDMVANLTGQIRTQQFMESPRVKDAISSVHLKDFFNRNNQDKRPDDRSLISQIVNRMGMDNERQQG